MLHAMTPDLKDCPTCISGHRTLACAVETCPREWQAAISALVWNSDGIGTISAHGQNEGLRENGLPLAGYVYRIEGGTAGRYRISVHLRGEEMAVTYLHYAGFTLDDAKREAEKFRALMPRVKALPGALIDRATLPHAPGTQPQALVLPTGKIVVPPGLLACAGALHAWNTDAGINETCRCGQITLGLALKGKK